MSEDPREARLKELEQELLPAARSRGNAVAETLAQESDRGCVIIGASFLEYQLELLIRAICRNDEESVKQVVDPLFKGYAPFATFSAKIKAAFALRLISSELKNQLDLIRKIRNDFAHGYSPVSFKTPQCQDRLQALIATAKAHGKVIGLDLDPFLKPDMPSPTVFAMIIGHIFGQIEQKRLQVTAGFYP